MSVRFGLFGTGFWAAEVHGAALAAAADDVELVGVWGRDPAKASTLAQRYGCRPYSDVETLIADVDAVDIALPPAVQAPIAAKAASAGRHLLLDKPLALTSAAAADVVSAAHSSGVASVVFFTNRFVPARAAWLAEQAGQSWHGGEAMWIDSLAGTPFDASPWRKEHGGLWDLGPHLLSIMIPLLGSVERVLSAVLDDDGTVRFVAQHGAGALSVQTAGQSVPRAAAARRLAVYGPAGWSVMPEGDTNSVEALGEALRQLLATIASGTASHPCDVRFAAEIVGVLEWAQARLDA